MAAPANKLSVLVVEAFMFTIFANVEKRRLDSKEFIFPKLAKKFVEVALVLVELNTISDAPVELVNEELSMKNIDEEPVIKLVEVAKIDVELEFSGRNEAKVLVLKFTKALDKSILPEINKLEKIPF